MLLVLGYVVKVLLPVADEAFESLLKLALVISRVHIFDGQLIVEDLFVVRYESVNQFVFPTNV